MFRSALPSDSISTGPCSLVREQTRSVMTEEPSSFMMLLSDRRPNSEAVSAHDKGRVPRLEPRTMSEVDDESGGGHALVCTAGSKHVVPRALLRTPAERSVERGQPPPSLHRNAFRVHLHPPVRPTYVLYRSVSVIYRSVSVNLPPIHAVFW